MAPRDAASIQEEVLEFVRKSEEAVLEVGRKWADAVAEFMPVEMPLVRELRKHVFEAVEELLRIQREFAQKVLDETRQAVVATAKPAATHGPRAAKRAHKAA
ncbi:MAG TPA: hypothetical protein VKU86_05210 [Acidimicrobiales bacterium]|nr:hypothetical protein [Acidimicrobiales bacterium]